MDFESYRQKAKFLGGKPLRGTIKQKYWAEKTRHQKLFESHLSSEDAQKILTAEFSCLTAAKFWIENRDVDKSCFKPCVLLSELESLQEAERQAQDYLDEVDRIIVNSRDGVPSSELRPYREKAQKVMDDFFAKQHTFNLWSSYRKIAVY